MLQASIKVLKASFLAFRVLSDITLGIQHKQYALLALRDTTPVPLGQFSALLSSKDITQRIVMVSL